MTLITSARTSLAKLPTMPTTNRPLLLIFIITLITLNGCGAHTSSTDTLNSPSFDPAQPIFLDIDIFRGSITITENSALTQIQIKRSFHARINSLDQIQANVEIDPPLNDSLDYISYQVTFTDHYRNTRQPAWIITATTAYPLPQYQWVNLDIQAPNLAGVSVQTSHGNVTINNSPAPISVANNHGNITVKTNYTITQDIHLLTAQGNIKLTIPLRSTGTIDVDAVNGRAEITLPLIQEITQPTHTHSSTTLDPGNNQIILRTTNGKAHVIVTAAHD